MKNIRWLRMVSSLVLGLLLAIPLWFFASRAYLRSESFQNLIAQGSLQFEGKDGYSPWPGYFIFHDFRFRTSTEKQNYLVSARSVAIHLNPFLLLKNHVYIRSMTIEGLDLRIIPRQNLSQKDEEQSEEAKADKKVAESHAGKESKPWIVEFQNVRLRNFQFFQLDDLRIKGRLDLKTSFRFDSKGMFELNPSKILVRNIEMEHRKMNLAEISQTEFIGALSPINLDLIDVKSLLNQMTLSGDIHAKLFSLASLSAYLKDLAWLQIGGESLHLTGKISLDHGIWHPGSFLNFETEKIEARALAQSLAGQGTLQWRVMDKTKTHLELKIPRFRLNKGIDGEGKDFSLSLVIPEAGLIPKLQEWQVSLNLPHAELKRLNLLNAFFPKSLGMKIEGGSGRLSAVLKASSDPKLSGGTLRVKGQRLKVSYHEKLKFEGDMLVESQIRRFDPSQSLAEFSSIDLDIRQLSFLDQSQWQGSLKVQDGFVSWDKKPSFKAAVTLEGDNLRPVLAFLVKDKGLPAWLMTAFDLKNPKAKWKIEATDKSLDVNDLVAQAGGFDLQGRYHKLEDVSQAKFLMALSGLKAGYSWQGEMSEIHFSDLEKWYARPLATRNDSQVAR